MLANAHDGDADYYDADALDEQVRARTAQLPDADVLDSLTAARDDCPTAGLRRPRDRGRWCTPPRRWARCLC